MDIARVFSRQAFRVGIFTLAAAALIGGCSPETKGGGRKSAKNTEVEVAEVRLQEVEFSRMITGRTEAFLLAEVRPQVSGIIRERLFKEGADVQAGDVLYQIDDASYKASHASAKAALAKAETNQELLRTKYSRFKSMLEQKAVSRQEFDDVEAAWRSAQAETRVKKAEAEEAAILYGYTRIKAPISGRIGLSSVTPGALVTQHQASMLASIQQIDPIYVKLTMSASELSSLRRKTSEGLVDEGSFGRVRLYFDDGKPYAHEGMVDFSDISVHPDTGSVTLRATFRNPDHLLLPNMVLRAELVEGRTSRAIMVPQPAVSLQADGSATIFVLGEGNRAEERTIQIVGSKGRSWQVGGGLEVGEKIIVNGFRYVTPGMEVKVTKPEGAK